MINFKKLSEEIHSASVERGFWEKQNSIWHCMGLVFTEIAEFVEADRANHHANLMEFEKWVDNFGLDFDIAFKENIKNTVEDELSDVVIRLFRHALKRTSQMLCLTFHLLNWLTSIKTRTLRKWRTFGLAHSLKKQMMEFGTDNVHDRCGYCLLHSLRY